MTTIRRFTPTGVKEFESRLKLLKSGNSANIESLIHNELYTEFVAQVEAPDLPYSSSHTIDRETVGVYFNVVLSRIEGSSENLSSDVGLWTWFSAKYFDLLTPANAAGERKIGDISRYIFDANNFQKYYRHLLNGPYTIVKSFQQNIDVARVVLATPVNAPGEAVEQIASRQEFISNTSLLALATHLYVDSTTKNLKTGSGGNGAGSPRRFSKVLAQLDRTWDTEIMKTPALLELLPKEFDRFR